MKKVLCTVLALCLICNAAAALAESEHAHTWGEWMEMSDPVGHSAVCTANDGAGMNAEHYNFSISIGEKTVRICAMCGASADLAKPLSLIIEAAALPVGENPAAQRGRLVARGAESPFEADMSIVMALTVAYEKNGSLATFKNQYEIQVPLGAELPDNWKLLRVVGASGDDSVQTAETWKEVEAACAGGVLSFKTKAPALFIIKRGE